MYSVGRSFFVEEKERIAKLYENYCKTFAYKRDVVLSFQAISQFFSDDGSSKFGLMADIFNEMIVFTAARDIIFGRFWISRRRNRCGLSTVEGSMSLSLKSKINIVSSEVKHAGS